MKSAVLDVQLALCVLIFFLSDVAQGIDYVLTSNRAEELLRKFEEIGNGDSYIIREELEIAAINIPPPLPNVALRQLMEAADCSELQRLHTNMYFAVMGRFYLQEELTKALFDVIGIDVACPTPIQVRAVMARVQNLNFTEQDELDNMIQTAGFDSQGRFKLPEFMDSLLDRITIVRPE